MDYLFERKVGFGDREVMPRYWSSSARIHKRNTTTYQEDDSHIRVDRDHTHYSDREFVPGIFRTSSAEIRRGNTTSYQEGVSHIYADIDHRDYTVYEREVMSRQRPSSVEIPRKNTSSYQEEPVLPRQRKCSAGINRKKTCSKEEDTGVSHIYADRDHRQYAERAALPRQRPSSAGIQRKDASLYQAGLHLIRTDRVYQQYIERNVLPRQRQSSAGIHRKTACSNQEDIDVSHLHADRYHPLYQEGAVIAKQLSYAAGKHRIKARSTQGENDRSDKATSTQEDTNTGLGDTAINDGGSRSNRNVCTQTSLVDQHSDVSKTRKCIHYTVPVKCWPRVNKSQQVIKELVERCSYFENLFHLSGQRQKYLSEIDVYVDGDVALDPTSLLVRRDKFETKGTVYLQVSQKNMPNESFSVGEYFSGIFIDREGVKLVEAVSSEQIDLVVTHSADKGTFVKQLRQSELQNELSSLLELVVFDTLTSKFNNLKQLYENGMQQPFTDETEDRNGPNFGELVIQHKDNVEELLGEIIAVFKRSTLPENKHPSCLGFEKKEVSKEVKEQLFGLDETIRGCGYSRSTFNVNVERLSDEEESTKRKKRVTNFLEERGITNVKFNIVSGSFAEYKHVGARISVPRVEEPTVYHNGTLGGFALFQKENENSSCALFSRHVALGCEEKMYIEDHNRQKTEFGEILEDTLKHGSYDIAAAKIHKQYVPQCDDKFKNSENVPLPGKLYTKPTRIDLQDLPVHLWGSVSAPGLGIIRIPELSFPEVDETYIQIEDRNPIGSGALQRMANEGDSGAIVCADDFGDEHVDVIAMLIGSNNDGERRNHPNIKGSYIAFPLHKGVEHLQMKTGGIFVMKGVTKDENNCL